MTVDFSRLQVGKHDLLVVRGEASSDTARNFEVLGGIRDALNQHLGFEGVIVQLPTGMDLECLSEEAGRQLYRALGEVYGDA